MELDGQRLALARHNAEVCGVAGKIEFVHGDFFKVAPGLQVSVSRGSACSMSQLWHSETDCSPEVPAVCSALKYVNLLPLLLPATP